MDSMLWLLTGLLAALLDYTFAVGFGLIASILLVTLLGIDPRIVAGTAALTQVLLAVIATALHLKAGNVSSHARKKAYLLPAFMGASIVGGFLAAFLAVDLNEMSMELVYSLLLALLAATMLYDSFGSSGVYVYQGSSSKELSLALIMGLLSGTYKALVGGGFSAFVLLAQRRLGVDVKSGVALAPLLKFPSFLVIGLIYYLNNYINMMYLLTLTFGALVGLLISIGLLKKINSNLILKITGIILIIIVFIRLTYLL